jgi:dihydropteroate synthase
MALWHFGREDVEVAVLEVGIGGRYDATSVVDPDGAPLVTGASGPALDTIREVTDVVTVGPPAETARADRTGETPTRPLGSPDPDSDPDPDVTAEETGMCTLTESSLALAGEGWAVETETPLLGQHQAVNAGIAATLARQVAGEFGRDVELTGSDIAAGIRNVHWPGRFEVMARDPLVVLDGAHNPAACATLEGVLDRFDHDGLHLVFGAMRDKDHREMCRALPAVDRTFLAEPDVDRAQDTGTLAAVFERATDAAVEECPSVLAAAGRALRAADPGDCVLVTGSLYTVAAARDRWTRTPTRLRTDTTDRARAAMGRADVPAATRRDRADSFVGETVRFHARRRVTRDIERAMLSLGGSCAVSGVEAADGHVEVVLSGTHEQLLDRLGEFRALGAPVMVGHSHKSMFRDVATDPEDRRAATVAATALAADRGADVVRVHDVPENADAVATAARTAGNE